MESRKEPLTNNHYYHIFSRSIAKYEIFNSSEDYQRIVNILDLYRYADFNYKYSGFSELSIINQGAILAGLRKTENYLIEIAAYCLMPTHIHLILKQVADHGITKYMAKVLNSYSRYFNIRHKRTGPLWASRFKSVLVSDDEQLLHLTRYMHLNPTSAGLVKKPENWSYSSYSEYIGADSSGGVCTFSNLFDLSAKEYRKFVLDRKSYQQELTRIKSILIDNYTG